jgi:amino-acid N-acetyltransferase
MAHYDLTLPSGCILRQATSQDIWSIRLLVLSAKLDPTQLRWQQFWVVEYSQNIIACGQLRKFVDVQELGSLVVAPSWRKRGLGSILTQHLTNSATQPLYLECLGEKLAKFYSRFGFVQVSFTDIPPGLQGKFWLSNLGKSLFKIPVIFMRYSLIND